MKQKEKLVIAISLSLGFMSVAILPCLAVDAH